MGFITKKLGQTTLELRAGTQDELIFDEVCLGNEYRLPEKFEPDDVIIDVGAHIGIFAAMCLERGAGRVVCIEPCPKNLDLLRKNLLPHLHSGRVHIHAGAVAQPWTTEKGLYYPTPVGMTAMPSTCRRPMSHDFPTVRVRAVNLNAILASYEKIRLLKIDCEGAEYDCLPLCTELSRVEQVVGETHHILVEGRWVSRHKELMEFLRRNDLHPTSETKKEGQHWRRFWTKRREKVEAHPCYDLNGQDPHAMTDGTEGVESSTPVPPEEISTQQPARKISLLIARFPFGNSEAPSVANWLVSTVVQLKSDPRIGVIHRMEVDDTPITMGRNRVLKAARDMRVDYVLMIDSDMAPDLAYPGAKPFLPGALDFALQHEGPCIVAAPYCGPPPHENVYVFRWAAFETNDPNHGMRLEQYHREEAAIRGGFEEVAALPTGLILINMRALERMLPPWFYYEWADKEQSEKASTEDVTFTRDASLAGVRVYCYWDAWAGHHKRKCVGKPTYLTVDLVREQFAEVVRRNHRSNEKLVHVGTGQK